MVWLVRVQTFCNHVAYCSKHEDDAEDLAVTLAGSVGPKWMLCLMHGIQALYNLYGQVFTACLSLPVNTRVCSGLRHVLARENE